MTFDSITHVTPDGKWFNTGYDATEQRLIKEMDEAKIEKAVLVGLPDYINNNFILEVCKRHSNRLVPCASFNPSNYTSPAKAARAIKAELKNSIFRLVKFHPRFNAYDPLDQNCLAVFDEISSWDKPLLVWLDTLLYNRNVNLRKPPVETIHEIVTKFSKLKFILLHGGGSYCLNLAEAIRDCPNATLDLSWTLYNYFDSSVYNDILWIAKKFDNRIIFGSDFPEIPIPEAFNRINKLLEFFEPQIIKKIINENLNNIIYGD